MSHFWTPLSHFALRIRYSSTNLLTLAQLTAIGQPFWTRLTAIMASLVTILGYPRADYAASLTTAAHKTSFVCKQNSSLVEVERQSPVLNFAKKGLSVIVSHHTRQVSIVSGGSVRASLFYSVYTLERGGTCFVFGK